MSSREAEILALITQGLRSEEIAARAYLSSNTVKTYIGSTYRKINVTSCKPGSMRSTGNRWSTTPHLPESAGHCLRTTDARWAQE